MFKPSHNHEVPLVGHNLISGGLPWKNQYLIASRPEAIKKSETVTSNYLGGDELLLFASMCEYKEITIYGSFFLVIITNKPTALD